MHALVVHANITDLSGAKRALDEQVLPMMRAAPGFVGAYFVALDDTHGVSVRVFETEEEARAAAPPPVGTDAFGVSVDAVQFGEVISST